MTMTSAYVRLMKLHLLHHELFLFSAFVMSWSVLRGARLLVSKRKYFLAIQQSKVPNYIFNLMANL